MLAVCAAIVAASAVMVTALTSRPDAGSPAAGSSGTASPRTSYGDLTSAVAPTNPPARVCAAPPPGPRTPPADAVLVSPGTNLADVVEAHSGGTTYWLAPGTHRLGPGAYEQVVPHQGDTFVGAPGAVLDGGQENLYAFGGRADGVTISHLTIQNFGRPQGNRDEGVINHDSASRWTVRSSLVQRNAGAGLMIGSGNHVVGNCLRHNGQYGFNAYNEQGVRDVLVEGNEITGNNTEDWERRVDGCGCTGGGKFWDTRGAQVLGNYVHDNRGPGLWADTNNVGFLVQGNYVSDNDAEGMLYEISYNAAVVGNTFVRNAIVAGPKNPSFPTAALYLSEAGSDSRVPGPFGDTFLVRGNVFRDNWSGVVAWENADRFAGSPANTSSGVTTLVNPKATVAACSRPATIRAMPYLADCRWKTQHVLVERNDFSLDASAVRGCRPTTGCGFNGVFSNYGTYPRWSPYQGEVVSRDITFEQSNVWRRNTYRGAWTFMVEELGNAVSWTTWRSAPYRQDAGSTLTDGPTTRS